MIYFKADKSKSLVNLFASDVRLEISDVMNAYLRATCGDFCSRCHNWFYRRQTSFMHIIWTMQDILTGLNYGLEFCLPMFTAAVYVSCLLVCYPSKYTPALFILTSCSQFFLRFSDFFRQFQDWQIVRSYLTGFFKLFLPIAFLECIWRPINSGIKLFVRPLPNFLCSRPL